MLKIIRTMNKGILITVIIFTLMRKRFESNIFIILFESLLTKLQHYNMVIKKLLMKYMGFLYICTYIFN